MTTDPHIYKGEFCVLHIRPSDAPESVEVEVFNRKRKNGLWVEVPVAKVRSMLAASVPPGSYTRTDEGAHIGPEGETDWHGMYLSENRRAEKAERERDEARDAARAAHRAVQEPRERFRATEPRPLTPNAITDERVKRAAHCMAMQQMPTTYSLEPDDTADKFHDDAREVLHAALTEPPPRPEGAEEMQADLATAEEPEMDDEDRRLIADHLAAMGYRKDKR